LRPEPSNRLAFLEAAAATLLPFAVTVGLAADKGGYFATSWGWAAIAACWAAATAWIVRARLEVGKLELVFLGALIMLTGWTALSAVWSSDATASILEAERTSLYAAVAIASALVISKASARLVVGAVVSGVAVIAAFSLATRLLPDHVGVFDSTSGYRLASPIGYWNGLAIFCAAGAIAAVGCAAHARRTAIRAASAAVVVVLVVTMYFTYGRAAWIAFGVGLAVALASDTRRLWLATTAIVVAVPAGAAVAVASQKRSLTTAGSTLTQAAHDGHRLAVEILLLALVAAASIAGVSLATGHTTIGRRFRRAYAGALGAVAVGVAVALLVAGGGPAKLAHRGYDAFVAAPTHPNDLNKRLFSLSGNGRSDLWRVAWHEYQQREGFGSGAGSYGRYFLAHQPAGVGKVVDAHSLYLETLAEIGPIGLALLVLTLAMPLVAVRFARRAPLVPGAAGAYTAFVVHAGVDWDWELAAVTCTALLFAATVLVEAPRRTSRPTLPTKIAALLVIAALAVFSLLGLVGNSALATSNTATGRGNFAKAEVYAHRAARWMPWSADPWRALGAAQRSAGRPAEARASFRKGIGIDSGDWRLWYGLSLTSSSSTSADAYARAVALFPRGRLPRPAAAGAGGKP
jgi:hypothetical protein